MIEGNVDTDTVIELYSSIEARDTEEQKADVVVLAIVVNGFQAEK